MNAKISFLGLLWISLTYGQETYEGLVLDALTLEPLPYSNLSWYSNKGAITNEEGRYQLFLEAGNDAEITFSHLGYSDLIIKPAAIKDTIFMVRQTYELDEVVVIDTDDLKNKVLANFEKNNGSLERCESFFFKQFSKENGKYINYLEAKGMVKQPFDHELLEVRIHAIRKTDDLVTQYVNYTYQRIPAILNWVTRNLLNECEIIDYDWIGPNLIEATAEDKKSKKKYILTIDTSDFFLLKVLSNDLTDNLGKASREQTLYDKGKKITFETFQQGTYWEYDFKITGDKYHINRIYTKGKGALVSKDKSIRHNFESEQLYLTTGVLPNCDKIKSMRLLKEGKSLRKINTKYNKADWERLNAVLPLQEQQKILDALGTPQ